MNTWYALVSFLAVTYAGHAPYLGGDIEDLFEETKRATVPVVEKKPITEKQRRDSTNYNAKFTDIARAYAEGYKAAIKAVQARAAIAKRRLMSNKIGVNPVATMRSSIPFGNNPSNTLLQKAAASLQSPRSFIPPSPEDGGTKKIDTEAKSTKSNIPSDSAIAVDPKTLLDPSITKKSFVPQQAPWAMPPHEIQTRQQRRSVLPQQEPWNILDDLQEIQQRSFIPRDVQQSQVTHEEPQRHQRSLSDYAFPHIPIELRTPEEQLNIAKLNLRARRQNIYFDDVVDVVRDRDVY